jgi:hypothetical protein
VTLLPAIALDLADGEAGVTDPLERGLYVIELEGLDDGGDEFHFLRLPEP